MAYSKQTFSTNQVATAAELNQIETNIQDHVHGVGSVSEGPWVQRVTASNAAAVNANGTITLDDTIPQNTEGTEVITVSITPKDTSNRLKIYVEISGTKATSGTIILSIFQDSTADALKSALTFGTDGEGQFLALTHEMAAGTTSSTTFKMRVAVTAGSFKVNANSAGSRVLGGAMGAEIIVEETRP